MISSIINNNLVDRYDGHGMESHVLLIGKSKKTVSLPMAFSRLADVLLT
jgi:hypothetical protein